MIDSALDPAPAPPEAADGPATGWAGAPLRSTLAFLAAPVALGAALLGLDLRLPPWALYSAAGALGLALFARTLRDPEWLLAVFVLYVPLKRTFVVPLGPGVNGTNALLALLLLACAARAARADRAAAERPALPTARLVAAFCAVSLLSVVTAGATFGFGAVIDDHSADLKGWLDHFVVFFTFLYLIRDGAAARRVVLYMMVGTALVLALGLREWLGSRFLDSIEKARLLGPQRQPNDFGAFLVYAAGPFLGLFLTQLRRARAWLLVPALLLLAKLLLATFSRGAYVGMAAAGVAAAWTRGRGFLLGAAVLGGALLLAVPQLVPGSLAARLGHTVAAETGGELDASSQTRIVLWKAGLRMTLESPLLGKGFKAFPRLKGAYTEVDVPEADNHNMFLYVSSQMGIPALLLFVWLLLRTWRLGASIRRAGGDGFRVAVGTGGAALAAGVAAVNLFGSRHVDIGVAAYFWIYLAALAHLRVEVESERPPAVAAAEGSA